MNVQYNLYSACSGRKFSTLFKTPIFLAHNLHTLSICFFHVRLTSRKQFVPYNSGKSGNEDIELCAKELLFSNFNIAVIYKISIFNEIATNFTYSQKSYFFKSIIGSF